MHSFKHTEAEYDFYDDNPISHHISYIESLIVRDAREHGVATVLEPRVRPGTGGASAAPVTGFGMRVDVASAIMAEEDPQRLLSDVIAASRKGPFMLPAGISKLAA